ncbi:MAG: DUF1800 family protein [Opitutae bacterium]|nr:DUF1800 family protein [Opitutae bacterium]
MKAPALFARMGKCLILPALAGWWSPLSADIGDDPLDYREWRSRIPFQPSGSDPDQDGVPSFLEYALGAAPEDAVNAGASGRPMTFQHNGENNVVLLPFPGRRDLAYYLDGKPSLNQGEWTVLAQKLGNAPWESVAEGFVVDNALGSVTLSYDDWPRAQFLRMRMEDHPTLVAGALAARFLKQTTFGPTAADIDNLMQSGLNFEGWINEQIALDPTLHMPLYYTYPVTNHIYPQTSEIRVGRAHLKGVVWFQAALFGQDQLRQRMAWALAQIFVIGQVGSNKNAYPLQWLNFYDILVRNAFGNYRDILQEVTLNAKMGYYLTYLNNQKAAGNRLPDENYAREVMQLFTVGLWDLNMDGTLKLDADQEPIPTYDNEDIAELAKVFTGLQHAYDKPEYDTPNRVDPMIVRNESRHDRTEKTMLDGTVLPAGVNTIPEITAALDVLFNHPNVPPFISFRLIQRLVSSNPSAEYVERVARVFSDNGEGVRGDLNAVVKTILLDPEARDAGYMIDNGRGKLQEPLLRFTHLCRAFKLNSNEANNNILWFTSYEDEFGQSPYRSPSVFNFYLPDFVPSGELGETGLYGPEFQILDDSTGMKTFQLFSILIDRGLQGALAGGANPRPTLDLSTEIELAGDAEALVEHLDLLLCHNSLGQKTKAIIVDSVEAIPNSFRQDRAKRAVLLVSISPESVVLQ